MSEATSKKNKNENQVAIKSRIDSKAELIEPIDYSFKDLINFEEINENHPRFPAKSPPKMIDGKFASLGFKLGYNALNNIAGIFDWCEMAFAFPKQISSIDLSFNCFTNIPNELLQFEGLKTIYLHGNKIYDLTEVEKFKRLKNLTSLTLHGNPVENLVGFRHYVLSKLPNLKHLNFSGISKADRATANVWVKSNNKPLKVETDSNKNKEKKAGSDDES